MNRTDAEIAQELHDLRNTVADLSQDVHDMQNALTRSEQLLHSLPFLPAGAHGYFEYVRGIQERRTARYMARRQEREDDLQFPVLYEETVGEPA